MEEGEIEVDSIEPIERNEKVRWIMNQNPTASDWVAARGKKWRAQLSGMEAMLKPVNAVLIRALHLDASCKIAEIGCGGGGTALEILRQAPSGSVVHGFDISPTLVEFARDRALPDEPGIVFEVADMATASAPEQPYDRLVSRFGVMFFHDPHAAFTNLFRWLVPGGRFAFAVWGPSAENPWMTVVRDVVADIIDIPPADPEGPGAFRYAEAGKLLALLDRAGFGELDLRDWRGAFQIGGGMPAAKAAHFALASFSSFSELLAEAGDKALNDARESLTTHFSKHQQDGVVQMDARVHIVTGARLE
jgi:SAM-dependent methyltransferase